MKRVLRKVNLIVNWHATHTFHSEKWIIYIKEITSKLLTTSHKGEWANMKWLQSRKICELSASIHPHLLSQHEVFHESNCPPRKSISKKEGLFLRTSILQYHSLRTVHTKRNQRSNYHHQHKTTREYQGLFCHTFHCHSLFSSIDE